jgi:two-component system invasion response regulator UvrY
MKKITVAIIDDHKLIREMWVKMFVAKSEVEVVGESGVFDEAIEMIKIKRPDIVLLDINLQQASGMDAVPLIRKFSPGTRIIAVSMHNQLAYAKKMLQLGAKAYVTKNSSYQEVFKAIDEVMNGKIYACTEIKDILSARLMANEPDGHGAKDLSLQEIEIVNLIKAGSSSREIAASKTLPLHPYGESPSP